MAYRPTNERYLNEMRRGFWVRTRQDPPRAVKWDPKLTPSGRPTYRGDRWVEVLPYGTRRAPERFYAADVTLAGPHEHLAYYPAVDEPVCGWGYGDGTFCPRMRSVLDGVPQVFCPRHEAELQGEEEYESGAPEAHT